MVNDLVEEEWFTLEDIQSSENTDKLYCISVDSNDKQFLIGDELKVPTHNSDAGKAEDELKGEAAMIIGSIARLGRAAGVHLAIATQRPDAKIISGETKSNLGVRINCGRTGSTASSMILDSGDGARVKANPRGRLFLRIYGSGNHGQGFFADSSWIDEYLESKGLNQDGTPISGRKSRLANLNDMSQLENEGDLDSVDGIDNEGVIDRIRQEESEEDFDIDYDDDDDDGLDDSVGIEPVDDGIERPKMGAGASTEDKFHRPEEDWDIELEDLIEENNA